MTTNTTQQTMEDGLKPLNLFDAVPFVAQTHFESCYSTYDNVPFSEIIQGVKEIYHLTGKEFPSNRYYEDRHYKVVKKMLLNAIDLIFDDPWTYDESCRVNTIELDKAHNIGYNS